MSKSNLLVLSSLSESFPNVLVEAHYLSLPVVTFDVGAAAEIVEHGRTGYVVTKGDQKSFEDCIYKILESKDRGRAMGKIGRERVLNLFSMEKKVARFLSLIEEDLKVLES
jgi:glycosyltransferase involved in cell wall biosynthesis